MPELNVEIARTAWSVATVELPREVAPSKNCTVPVTPVGLATIEEVRVTFDPEQLGLLMDETEIKTVAFITVKVPSTYVIL